MAELLILAVLGLPFLLLMWLQGREAPALSTKSQQQLAALEQVLLTGRRLHASLHQDSAEGPQLLEAWLSWQAGVYVFLQDRTVRETVAAGDKSQDKCTTPTLKLSAASLPDLARLVRSQSAFTLEDFVANAIQAS